MSTQATTVLSVRIRAVAAIFIAALLVATCISAANADAKVTKGPAGLAFYKPPKNLPKGHGDLIWARKAGGTVPLKKASSNQNVLYTSVTPAGKRVAVSGTVSFPKGKAPKSGWPVITYAHGTTGTADICAPSRNSKSSLAKNYISYTDPQLNAWLKAGYAVARTDYQGLGTPGPHEFLVGQAEGRGVLDIVRAARQLGPRVSKKFLIAGHSQGGHASLFAAGDAAYWVPDLKLRGTIAFAPASHLREQAALLPALTSPSSLTALATLVVKGAASAHPQFKPQELLSDPVLAFYPQTDTACEEQLAKTDSLGGIAPSEMIRAGADTTPLFDFLELQNPAVRTKSPIYLAQGTADTTTLPFQTDQLVNELGVLGDKVNYVTYPGIDHGHILQAAETDVLAWMERKLPSGR